MTYTYLVRVRVRDTEHHGTLYPDWPVRSFEGVAEDIHRGVEGSPDAAGVLDVEVVRVAVSAERLF